MPAESNPQGLSHDEKALMRRLYTELAALIPGFRARPQQREMIAAASNALTTGGTAMIEAPTGVGKTFGYLVPGLVLAVTRKRRLVVATATAALQDQIAAKDQTVLSRALNASGARATVAVLKGRGRYVCPIRLHGKVTRPGLFDDPNCAGPFGQMLDDLERGDWNGERDALNSAVDDAAWAAVANHRRACIGERCRMFARCPYFVAQEAGREATVVITNHDHVLASLANSENCFYAEFERNYFVFDEAHHLPEKAMGAFASRFGTDTSWAEEIPALIARAGARHFKRAATTEVAALRAALTAVAGSITSAAGGRKQVRFPFGRVPSAVRLCGTQVSGICQRLGEFLAAARSVDASSGGRVKQAEAAQIALGIAVGRVEDLADAWAHFCDETEPKPRARWAERDGEAWSASTSPFDAGPLLDKVLWGKARGAILTSATLAPLGAFDVMRRELGFWDEDAVRCLRLGSPFDYAQARLLVPRMGCLPEDTASHTTEVGRHLEAAARRPDGGVLVLFASREQLQDVYRGLSPELRADVLVQGELPVRAILVRHRERIEAGARSIIMGLASFAEGIDLPGRLCTKVLIAKLPFPSPEEPLVAAASEWIESKGGRAFFSVSLPRAGMRLAQAVGRLMRSETDHGQIIVLDRRLLEQPSYRARLAAGLPLAPHWMPGLDVMDLLAAPA